jgi:hypothetical protein
MKDTDRQKFHKQIEKLSKPVSKSKEKKLTNKELADILRRR